MMPNDPVQRCDHDLLGWLNKPQHFCYIVKTPVHPLLIDHFSDNPLLSGNRSNTLNDTVPAAESYKYQYFERVEYRGNNSQTFPCKTNFSPTVRYVQHLQGASFSEDRLEPTLTLSKSLVLNGYSNIPGTAHKLRPCPHVRGYWKKKTFLRPSLIKKKKIPIPADDILK